MAVLLLLLLLLVGGLFAFTDVWYFLRITWLRLEYRLSGREGGRQRRLTLDHLLAEYVRWGIVLPSDIDFMMHMNNSKYLREMDFGRIGLSMERGIHSAVRKLGALCVLGAASIRYRRSLHVFQRFSLTTRVVCWDETSIYMEQRVVARDGFVSAINLAKLPVRGATPQDLIREVTGETVASPAMPPEVTSWMESMKQSSEALRREAGLGADQKGAGLGDPPLNSSKKD